GPSFFISSDNAFPCEVSWSRKWSLSRFSPGGPAVIGNLQCVVLDCAEPLPLARFYQALLGGTVNKRDRRWDLSDEWVTLHTASGQVLAFQGVEDHRPPRWPESDHPQQFHLDVGVEDLDRAHQQVLASGATLLDDGGGTRGWRIYADPAGHPFCLVLERPRPRNP
ncbi:VOC family protein, partial [Planotetraspora mira]|uniref:VOC family protein n=1 Tax=Planotetraspora mira TaxID=58121 RepID=UPI0027E56EDB